MAATKRHRNISGVLKFASCTLLSSTSVVSQVAKSDGDYKFDGAILHYSEKDRVQVLEPVFAYRKYKQFDEFVEYKVTIDTMTGSSPNGATPSNVDQTFTGASGQSGYSVAAGETPMRDFSDTRIALNIMTEAPLSIETRRSTGYAFSYEQDYGALGYNTTYLKDTNDKHTTLAAGVGVSLDLVFPSGGTPEPLTNINDPSNQNSGDEDGEEEGEGGEGLDGKFKGTFDVLFGITQILNRYALMQLNYSHSFVRGYLTDPYKVVSVVDSNTGEPALTPTTTNGIYLTEKRPDSRDTNVVYWKSVVNIFGDVLRLSYRYFWDDWGIKSNTIDATYRFDIGDKFYIEPHYRYYTQTAADFYRHSIRNNEPLPDYVSADYRLAEFDGETIGIKIGADLDTTSKFAVRLEQYTQTGNSYPADAVGIQQNYNLYPPLEATIIQISYSKFF